MGGVTLSAIFLEHAFTIWECIWATFHVNKYCPAARFSGHMALPHRDASARSNVPHFACSRFQVLIMVHNAAMSGRRCQQRSTRGGWRPLSIVADACQVQPGKPSLRSGPTLVGEGPHCAQGLPQTPFPSPGRDQGPLGKGGRRGRRREWAWCSRRITCLSPGGLGAAAQTETSACGASLAA